jgi:hypothetical protein
LRKLSFLRSLSLPKCRPVLGAYASFDVPNPRNPSNDMPNGCYLAWRLISPVATAKLFSFKTSNLPPSKEAGQGDCGPPNQMDTYGQKVLPSGVSLFVGCGLPHHCLICALSGHNTTRKSHGAPCPTAILRPLQRWCQIVLYLATAFIGPAARPSDAGRAFWS